MNRTSSLPSLNIKNLSQSKSLDQSKLTHRYVSPPIRARNPEASPHMLSQISPNIDGISRISSLSNLDLKFSLSHAKHKTSADGIQNTTKEKSLMNLLTNNSGVLSYLENQNEIFNRTAQKDFIEPINSKEKKTRAITWKLRPVKSDSRLSQRTMNRVGEDLRKIRLITRDMSPVLEPIAKENAKKIKVINEAYKRRSVSMEAVPKSAFEEKVLSEMQREFLRRKLKYEVRGKIALFLIDK